MKGIQNLRISNRNVVFELSLCRNITIVRGDSGTGKTTLYSMIADHARFGAASGVSLVCDKACIALNDMDWVHQLHKTSDSIVFVDEGDRFVYSKEFAEEIRKSDNYYVLFIRENLHELPYSVEEIYEIKTSGKYHTLKQRYKGGANCVYAGTASGKKNFHVLLTEDAKSGLQFFEHYYQEADVECITTHGNSGIFGWLEKNLDKKVFVLADGAAFGAEMNRVMELQKRFPDRITICLPESFEWLILRSGLIAAKDLENILKNPSEYIDSNEHFSWEQFFYRYLVENTKDTYKQYSKERIGQFYVIENNAKQIAAVIGI